MLFNREESAESALERIREGVGVFEGVLSRKERRLSELFVLLKEDILSSDSLSLAHVRVLQKQVRHILSVARAIGFVALENVFLEEQEVLEQLVDLFEQYPSLDVSSSADVQASLQNLRRMILSQQEMIFRHKEVLSQEKRRLVQILQEASSLEEDLVSEHRLVPSSSRVIH
ncbi:MAG: hypothetical protein ACMXYD_01330 [Candidatus Woesearchaeota archaeon]